MAKGRSKLVTGIEGFDFVTRGGIPERRATLVTGTSGSGKTIFAMQFLAEGIQRFEHPGVFVTFEEDAHDIRGNVGDLPWPVERWEASGHWRFVDASPQLGTEQVETGDFDLGALLARIEHAVDSIGAERASRSTARSIVGVTVLKMRGSSHDKEIREFIIDDEGTHIGQAFGNLSGILAGNPHQIDGGRPDPFRNMFADDPGQSDA